MLPPEDGPKPKPRFDQVNVARQRIIRRNLDALHAKGASDDEVESYLRDDEGLAPAGEASKPAPVPLSGPEASAGRLLSVAQGGMFNLADEAAGGLHAITRLANGKPFGENYREGRDAVRGVTSRFGEQHHKEQIALEMAGGIAPATTLPLLKNLGAVKGGAAFGAAYGAGGAEGDLSGRALGAGVGAVAGGVGGAAAEHLIAPVVAAGIRKAAPLLSRAAPIAAKVGNFLEQRGLGLSTRNVSGANPPPNAARATSPTRLFGRVQETADAYAPATSRERAAGTILRNVGKDKRTVERMLVEAQAAPVSQPLTALELADENVMGVARAARGIPSEAKRDIPKALVERQKGEHGRARTAIEGAAGVKPGDPELVTEDLVTRTRANAKPVYEKAYADPPIDDPEALQIFSDPAAPAIYKSATRQAAREGVTLPPLEDVVAGKAPMPVQGFDYFKRGVDDYVESRMGAGKLGKNEARQLRGRMSESLSKVDAQRPNFAAARQQFAGDKEMELAAESGKEFLTTDDRKIGRLVQSFTPGEREVYAQTALDAIDRQIRATGDTHDVYNRVFGNSLKRDALKSLVGDEAFQGLEQEMEAMARRTRSLRFVTGGSNTVDKASEQLDLESDGIMKVIDAGGSPKRMLLQELRQMIQNRRDGITKKTADDLGNMLTAGASGGQEGRASLLAVLRELRAVEEAKAAREATRRSTAPLTRPFAAQAGGATSPRNERR